MPTEQIETGVILPESGIIDAQWMSDMLAKVDIFSQELLNYGRGQIFFMAQSNLDDAGFEQAVSDLGYTVDTVLGYIRYLQKKPVLEAIKTRYYTALSLSAAEIIPDDIEGALALCDVCVAKYGKLTADNLTKAASDTGLSPKKMSDAAVGIEAAKKKALNEWLASAYDMSTEDIQSAGKINTEGKSEFMELMLNAYDRLEDWSKFYGIIAKAIHESDDSKSMRFLADLNNASQSITEYLASEHNFKVLEERKEKFESEIYPELQFLSLNKE